MNVLVVGGAGYIGSHTAKQLSRAGHTVTVLDNLSTGHEWAVKWGVLERVDLANQPEIERVLETHNIESVIHFAGSAYVGESMQKPAYYFNNNVTNSLNLLEAMHKTGVNNIVFSSSCTTYGIPTQVPIAEDAPQNPISPYGESKLMVEKMLHWFHECHGIKWVALRYFNASGADPEGEIGEQHDPETHLIPLVIGAALGTRPPIQVFGTDYPTPDGTAIRDYIHVNDLASAHIKALEYLVHDGKPRAFNLGTGTGHSVLEVIKMVEKVSGKKVPHVLTMRRAGDPAILVANSTAAKTSLQWKPSFGSLEVIVKTALERKYQSLEAVSVSQ
jgi:UDP-arabinose 4-epimerase